MLSNADNVGNGVLNSVMLFLNTYCGVVKNTCLWNLSVGTIRNWGKEYVIPSIPTSSTSQSLKSSIFDLGPIDVTVPSFKGAWWNSWECDPLYAENEAKWR